MAVDQPGEVLVGPDRNRILDRDGRRGCRRGDAGTLLRDMRRELLALDPNVVFVENQTMEAEVDATLFPMRASAWLVSSGVYALVHFFQKPPPPEKITWISGFEMLPRMLHGFAELETLVPGFFALTLTGLILAMGYHRTGSLYFPIGLHAGWVFCLKLYGFLTAAQPGADAGFWGTEKLIDGWLALIVLAPVLIAVSVWPRQKRSAADAK